MFTGAALCCFPCPTSATLFYINVLVTLQDFRNSTRNCEETRVGHVGNVFSLYSENECIPAIYIFLFKDGRNFFNR